MINNLDRKVKDEIQPVADVTMSDAFETSEKMRKLTRKELAELRAKRKEQMKQLQIKPEDQRGLIDAPLNESKEQLKEFYVLSDGVNPRHSEVFVETEEGKESAINAAKSREGHWEVIHTFFKENEKSPTQEVIFVKEDEEKKEEALKEDKNQDKFEKKYVGKRAIFTHLDEYDEEEQPGLKAREGESCEIISGAVLDNCNDEGFSGCYWNIKFDDNETFNGIPGVALDIYDLVDEKLLESTFRGVEGTEFIWHGEWSDPEIEYKDEVFNYWDVEDALWTDFKDAIEQGEIKADEDDEEAFNKFCQEHAPAMLDDWIYAKEHKDESLKEKKQLKETWAGEDVIDDIVERAQANLKDGEDESDAIFNAIDEGLIYTKDIYTLVEHYGSIDTITMIESFYDDLYNDVASRLDLSDEEIEELGEKLKQHHEKKKQLKEAISDKVHNYWSEVIEDYINRVEDLTTDERIVKASQQDINDLCTRVAEEIMNDNSLWKEIDDAIEWHIYHDDFMLNQLKESKKEEEKVDVELEVEEEPKEEEKEEVEVKEEEPEEEKKEEIKGLGLERAKKLAKLINENELILSMIEEEEIEPEEAEIKLETEDREEKFKFNDDDSVDVFIKKDNAEYDEEKDELVDVVIEKHFDTFKEWLEDELTQDDAFLIYISLNKIDNESEDAEEESEEVKRFVADFDALDEFEDVEDDFKEGDIILDTEEVKVVESNNRNTSYVNVKQVNNTVNEDLDDCDNIEISQDQLDEMLKEANPQLVIKKPE